MKTVKDVREYIKEHIKYFEISRFEGDIFWYNDCVYSVVYGASGLSFFSLYAQDELKANWIAIDTKTFDNPKIQSLYRHYFRNPQALRDNFYTSCQKGVARLDAIERLDVIDRKKYSDFMRSLEKVSVLSVFCLEAFEKKIFQELNFQIRDIKMRALLTTPLYTSYINTRTQKLYEILKKLPKHEQSLLRRKNRNISRYAVLLPLLRNYGKQWGWSFLHYGSHHFPDNNELLNEIIEMYRRRKEEVKLMRENIKKQKQKKRALQKQPKKVRDLIRFYDTVLEIRDQRKAYWLKLLLPMKQHLRRIAKKYGFSFDDIRWLTWQEQCLLGEKPKKHFSDIIHARRSGCVVWYAPTQKKIITGVRAREIIQAILYRKRLKELHGVSASGGKVTGAIQNISNSKEFKSFKTGSILAASHTTPDYIPVMKRARAILTERGGITSHAAIISRELGIPCIVGMKGLFQNFKDGERVRVDADAGTVVLLKRYNY